MLAGIESYMLREDRVKKTVELESWEQRGNYSIKFSPSYDISYWSSICIWMNREKHKKIMISQ